MKAINVTRTLFLAVLEVSSWKEMVSAEGIPLLEPLWGLKLVGVKLSCCSHCPLLEGLHRSAPHVSISGRLWE